MWVLSEDEFKLHKFEIEEKIREGVLFIYPTDTIYGVGCDATNKKAVALLRKTKKTHTRPLSIIAPSKEWILQNCVITPNAKEWLGKIPGPYTFIFKLKNKQALADNVYETNTVGVRIPKHWISDFVSKLGLPIITTSANVTGQPFMRSIEDLDSELRLKTDFAIDAGLIDGKPSTIVDLTNETKILRK